MGFENAGELMVLVDEDDNVTGYMPRAECHEKRLLHRTASLILMNKRGEILIQERAGNLDMFSGDYTLSASGHVNPGESYEDAIRKEMREELGISGDMPLMYRGAYLIGPDISTHVTKTGVFMGKSNGPFNPDPKEVKSLIWMHPKILREKIGEFTPNSAHILRELLIV